MRKSLTAAMILVAALATFASIAEASLVSTTQAHQSSTAASDARSRQSSTANTQSPPLAPLPAGNGAQAFAFDRRFPNIVYVASAHAGGGVYVFKTVDGGQHWRSTGARGIGWESDILTLTSDPLHRGTLYAGTGTAVYKTSNGGRSWRPFRRGLFPTPHQTCSGPPGRPQCRKYPYAGTPGKANWNRGTGWVLDVAIDPGHSNVVYSAAGGVRKSTDGGHTWKSVLEPQLKWTSVTSYGRTWKNVLKPQSKWTSATRIVIAPTRPESIYAITHNPTGRTAIYRSTDAGQTWRRTGSPGSNLPPSCCGGSEDALTIDSANPQMLYAVVGSSVFATKDGGASWHPRANGLPANSVTSLAADPQRSKTLYASVDFFQGPEPTGGIYETTDGGQRWNEIWSGFGIGKVAVDPARPSTIYATSRAGGDASQTPTTKDRLLRSTDGGHTWAISP